MTTPVPREPQPRPIRVVCLIKGLGRGGAEMLLLAQIRERNKVHFNYQVVYLSPRKDALVSEFEAEGVQVTCLRAPRSSAIGWIVGLRRLLTESDADIVHVHSPVAAVGARLAVRSIPILRRPRIVTTEHNVWQSHVWLTRRADAMTARLDNARIAVSTAVRASLPARLQPRTEVIRHGIDVAAVAGQRAARDVVRKELGVEDRLVVCTVANLRVTKGWPDLLLAAQKVLAEVDDACFVAVGQGPMEDEIAALHRHLRLGERFIRLGYRTDAVRIMAGCDIFCLPSHNEGLPVAVMEAMAIGLPIVATDVGGVSDLVVDRLHGRLVPPHRPDVLAAALVEMLTDDRHRKTCSDAVLSKADSLSEDRAIRRIEAIYAVLGRQRMWRPEPA